MNRILTTIGLSGIAVLLLGSVSAVWAQDACVKMCREEMNECFFDTQEELSDCLQDADCRDLKETYRAVCKANGRRSKECRQARKELSSSPRYDFWLRSSFISSWSSLR